MASIAGPSNTVDPNSTDPVISQFARSENLHDSYCWRCKTTGGTLLLCEKCTCVFHDTCLEKEECPAAADEDASWKCPLCVKGVPNDCNDPTATDQPNSGDILLYTPPADPFPGHIVEEVKIKLELHHSQDNPTPSQNLRQREGAKRRGKRKWMNSFPQLKGKKFLTAKQGAELFIALTNYRCEDWRQGQGLAEVRRTRDLEKQDWIDAAQTVLTGEQIEEFPLKKGRGKPRWVRITTYLKKIYKTWITEAFEEDTLGLANDDSSDDSGDDAGSGGEGDETIQNNISRVISSLSEDSDGGIQLADDRADRSFLELNDAADSGLTDRLKTVAAELKEGFKSFDEKMLKSLTKGERKTLDLEIGRMVKNRFEAIAEDITDFQYRQYARTVFLGCNGRGKSTMINLLLLLCEKARSLYGSNSEMIQFLVKDLYEELTGSEQNPGHRQTRGRRVKVAVRDPRIAEVLRADDADENTITISQGDFISSVLSVESYDIPEISDGFLIKTDSNNLIEGEARILIELDDGGQEECPIDIVQQPRACHLNADEFKESVHRMTNEKVEWVESKENDCTPEERERELAFRKHISNYCVKGMSETGLKRYSYLFPVNNGSTSTTAIGKGVRFGPEFALVIKFKEIDELLEEVQSYDFTLDENASEYAKHQHTYMMDLVQALKYGRIEDQRSDSESEEEDDEDVANTSLSPTRVENVHQSILEISGKTKIFTAEGRDSIADQIYIRSKIKHYTRRDSEEMKALRMFIEDMIVYVPNTFLEGKKTEIRDIPGAADNDSIKTVNLLKELDVADHVIIVMARNLDADSEMKRLLETCLLPRYIGSKNISSWLLLSKLPAKTSQQFLVEELLERVQQGEEAKEGLVKEAKELFLRDLQGDHKTPHQKEKEMKTRMDLFEKCYAENDRGRGMRRLDIDFVIIPEKDDPLTGKGMIKKINGEDGDRLEKLKKDNDWITRNKCLKKLLQKMVPGKACRSMRKMLKEKPRVITLYPFLYTSVVTSTQSGFETSEVTHSPDRPFDRHIVMGASGGREWLHLFDSGEARHLRHCVNNLIRAFERYDIRKHPDHFGSSAQVYHPQITVYAKRLKRRERKNGFIQAMKVPISSSFGPIPNLVHFSQEEETRLLTNVSTLFSEFCGRHRNNPRDIVRAMSTSKTAKEFYMQVRNVMLKSQVFNIIQTRWIENSQRIKQIIIEHFEKHLHESVRKSYEQNKDVPQDVREQLGTIIKQCLEHYAQSALSVEFKKRHSIGWLNTRSSSNQLLWRKKLENRLGNYLCKTNFKYNAKEMRGKNLEFIMARFNEQSKLYLQCCEREVLEVTEKTWNDAIIKTRERVLKLIPKKLYVKMIRSCTSDQRGKQKFFECLQRLDKTLKMLKGNVENIRSELINSTDVSNAVSEKRIRRMRIIDSISDYNPSSVMIPKRRTMNEKGKDEWSRRCRETNEHEQIGRLHNFFTSLPPESTLAEMQNVEWKVILRPYRLSRDDRSSEGTLCEALDSLAKKKSKAAPILTSHQESPEMKKRKHYRRRKVFRCCFVYIVEMVFRTDESQRFFETVFSMTLKDFQSKFAHWDMKMASDPMPNELKTPLILGYATLYNINLDVWVRHKSIAPTTTFFRISPYNTQTANGGRSKLFKSPWTCCLCWDGMDKFRSVRKLQTNFDGSASECSRPSEQAYKNSYNRRFIGKNMELRAAILRNSIARSRGDGVVDGIELPKETNKFHPDWDFKGLPDGKKLYFRKDGTATAKNRFYAQIKQSGYEFNERASTAEYIVFAPISNRGEEKRVILPFHRIDTCTLDFHCKQCELIFKAFSLGSVKNRWYSLVLENGYRFDHARSVGERYEFVRKEEGSSRLPESIPVVCTGLSGHRFDQCYTRSCMHCKAICPWIVNKIKEAKKKIGASSVEPVESGSSAGPQCGTCAETGHSARDCPNGRTCSPRNLANRKKRKRGSN